MICYRRYSGRSLTVVPAGPASAVRLGRRPGRFLVLLAQRFQLVAQRGIADREIGVVAAGAELAVVAARGLHPRPPAVRGGDRGRGRRRPWLLAPPEDC